MHDDRTKDDDGDMAIFNLKNFSFLQFLQPSLVKQALFNKQALFKPFFAGADLINPL